MSSSENVKKSIKRSIFRLISEKRQTEYGSPEYINELDVLIDELKNLKIL